MAPMADMSPLGAPAAELAALREHATVTLIKPDAAAKSAIGQNGSWTPPAAPRPWRRAWRRAQALAADLT